MIATLHLAREDRDMFSRMYRETEASSIHTHATASGSAHQHNGNSTNNVTIHNSNSQTLPAVALGYAVGAWSGRNPIAKYQSKMACLSIPSMVYSTRKTNHWQYSSVNPTVVASQPRIKPTTSQISVMGDRHQPPTKGLKSRNARYHAPSIRINSDLVSQHCQCHEKAPLTGPSHTGTKTAAELPSTARADPAMAPQDQRKRKLSNADHPDTHPKRIATSGPSDTTFSQTAVATTSTSPGPQHSISNLNRERSTWTRATTTMSKYLRSQKPRPNRLLGGTRSTVPLDARNESGSRILRRLKSGASRIQKGISVEGKRGARISLKVGAIGGRALNSGFRLSAASVRWLVESFAVRLLDYARTGAAACLNGENIQLLQTGAAGMSAVAQVVGTPMLIAQSTSTAGGSVVPND